MSFETVIRELAESGEVPAASQLVDLSGMGPEGSAAFMDAWPLMQDGVRQRLIAGLADLAEDNVELNFAPIFVLALSDREPEVRRRAVAALWEYEGRDLIDRLIGLLEGDPEPAVRADAALGLGRFVLLAELDDLGATDIERIERILRRVIDDFEEPAEVRGRALESIGARSEDWVRDLIEEAFESTERRLRISAVHAMGRNCDSAWLPSIITEMESDDPEMRFEAAVASGSIEDEEAVEPLIALLEDDDAEVQDAAIAALGEIGGARSKEALQSLSEGADERMRDAAAAALAEVEFAEDPLGVDVEK